jgi:hypothetical protein
MFRRTVTLALDWDPGERDIDHAQVLTNKLNGGRPEILFQAFQLPRPRNRYDPGFLSHPSAICALRRTT